MKKQVELSITHNGKDVVAYPYSKKEHVQFENGMNIDEFVGQDIATPTITHDTTAIKVGVGDSDVSGSVVDGTVNMTIKGQTYQNILPEPSLRNKMIGKSMQQLNEGYDNIEVVDGVSKSAILSGQTLVNIFQFTSKDDFVSSNALIIEGTAMKFNADGSYQNFWLKNNGLVKANTNYLFILDILENTLVYKDGTKDTDTVLYLTSAVSGSNDSNFFQHGAIIVVSDLKGSTKRFIKKMTSNPTSTGTELLLTRGFLSPNAVSGTLKIKLMIIEYQDGMENWDIPYFASMQSVKMPVLTTTGKNLFNIEDNTHALTKLENGNYRSIPFKSFNLPKFKEKTSYTLSFSVSEFHDGTYQFPQIMYTDGTKLVSYRADKTFNGNPAYILTSDANKTISHIEFSYGTNNIVLEFVHFQIEEGSKSTSYEPYKSNILSTPEDLILRGIGDVKDTLDLATGELTQRIGEIVLDGSENWKMDINGAGVRRYFLQGVGSDLSDNTSNSSSLLCDKFKASTDIWTETNDGIQIIKSNGIYFIDSSVDSLDAFVNKLKTTNIKVQYSLIEKPVKTVDLSTSGNWEKIVLDGSESWRWGISDKTTFWQCKCEDAIANMRVGALCFGQGDKSIEYCNTAPSKPYQVHINAQPRMVFTLPKDAFEDSSEFKQYLSQNPITVWYQTATALDSTNVKQPIFFKDGHIQLSSGADNSLIPTLDYQAKTKNSYVMDLMKPNTQYTMKAKSVSGTFTIDDTSYNVNANGTFTSPSSMTDKLLIMSNKTNEEVMLLEGNVIDKTIPYFKGIKSAFEDEDKIEVLSTNHNLWTGVDNYTNNGATIILKDENECVFEHHAVNNGIRIKVSDYEYQVITMSYDFEILDGKALNVGGHNRHETKAYYIDGVNMGTSYHNGHATTYEKNRVYHVDHVVHINLPIPEGQNNDREYIGIEPNRYSADTPTYCKMRVTNFQIALGNVIKEYEPPKSNVTKIPLLSPLRSLPNGVCDELIIDRMKKKATLIQRVGKLIHHGQGGSVIIETKGEYHKYGFYGLITPKQNSYNFNSVLMCDTFMWNDDAPENQGEKISSYRHTTGTELRYVTSPNRTPLLTESYFRDWLSRNPVTVYYELETPVITEVDLEGFPYIYKDGHIFLNSDIAPTTQITYSINQAQQIESANENLQRHEKEISHLQKLIAQYIQVEYESTLLSLKI